MHIAVSRESIHHANTLFWEQMLAMELIPVHEEPFTETHLSKISVRCVSAGHVVGSCDISGAWHGRIEIRLAPGLALQATAAMLMQPVEAVQSADTLDAAKEIANMIAGTIKSALPRPCSMTVPSASVETAEFCTAPSTAESMTVFFHHEAGELMVRVWEQAAEAEPEACRSCLQCA